SDRGMPMAASTGKPSDRAMPMAASWQGAGADPSGATNRDGAAESPGRSLVSGDDRRAPSVASRPAGRGRPCDGDDHLGIRDGPDLGRRAPGAGRSIGSPRAVLAI